jgi:hypothetical protein
MSIARKRISKHASLTIEAVFSSWAVRSGYKEVFGSIKQHRTVVGSEESNFEAPAAGICALDQRNRIESSLRNWQLQNNGKKGVRLSKEDSSLI